MNQTSLHRFRVIALLGKGGMSDVYLAAAQGPGGFHKLMVLKLLKPELARDTQYCRMFQDEARLTARLNHPNVVQTYEVGEFEGRAFIAMEYLEGQPLSRVTERMRERGVVPTAFALRAMIGALDGLHYAHELRDYDGRPLCIVHRDATPQNIFLTYQGQIKLVDFGVAKSIAATAETTVGTVKGKVSYMAPEQARGEAVDRRTDVFAMGIVLWELLSGRRLWEGLTDVAVIARLMQGDLPGLAGERPDLPEPLTRLCMSALDPDPSRRPQTALELQLSLERQLALSPVSISQRKLGEILSLAFAPEREQVGAVVARQLERLQKEPITGVHAGAPRLHQLSATPLPILGVGAAIHEAPTAAHAPTNAELRTGRSGTAVIAATDAGSRPASGKNAYGVPVWTLVASVLSVALVVAAASYLLFARREEGPSHAAAPPPKTPAAAPLLPASGCDAVNKPLVELSGDIAEDATLRCDKEYLLRYTTSVQAGATLTIQAGTVIKGDRDTKGTLVVQPGGRIDASGTRDRPIVLTSSAAPSERRAGDWGGVVILGRAPTNHHDSAGRAVGARIEGLTKGGEYGGRDPEDSSGTLRFLRIEYSGDEIAPNNEINGLSLGGVGRGTIIDHILVRHTADDCFEFFGGTVDAKHLVCQAPGDDAFDWDFGYVGRLQFLVAQASPAERSGSNGFEGDNDPAGSSGTPVSRPQIYNATLCGKNRRFAGEHYGLLLRRGTQGVIRNTIVTGFLAGLDLRDRATTIDVQNTTFFGNLLDNLARAEGSAVEMAGAEDQELLDDDGGLDERALLRRGGTNNLESDPRVRDCFDRSLPGFLPERSLEGLGMHPPDDGFFDPNANYPGAVDGSQDAWLTGAWAKLDD